MSVCVNADRTGLLAFPPFFFTKESHLENLYCLINNTYDSNSLKFVLFVQQVNKIHVNAIEYNIGHNRPLLTLATMAKVNDGKNSKVLQSAYNLFLPCWDLC